VDGGVAIGADIEVVTQAKPRIATAGKDSVLQITVDPRFLSAGLHTGTVIIDTLLGTGATATFNVTVQAAGGGSGSNPTPTPAPTEPPPSYKAIVPNLSSEANYN
jgi:hypothetical protein